MGPVTILARRPSLTIPVQQADIEEEVGGLQSIGRISSSFSCSEFGQAPHEEPPLWAIQDLAQELRKRYDMDLFNFDLIQPDISEQPGEALYLLQFLFCKYFLFYCCYFCISRGMPSLQSLMSNLHGALMNDMHDKISIATKTVFFLVYTVVPLIYRPKIQVCIIHEFLRLRLAQLSGVCKIVVIVLTKFCRQIVVSIPRRCLCRFHQENSSRDPRVSDLSEDCEWIFRETSLNAFSFNYSLICLEINKLIRCKFWVLCRRRRKTARLSTARCERFSWIWEIARLWRAICHIFEVPVAW